MADEPQPPEVPPPPPAPPVPTPVMPPPPPAASAASAPPTWRSLRGLATVLTWLLALDALAAAFAIYALVKRLGVVSDLENGAGGFDIFDRAQKSDDLVSSAAITVLVLALLTAVFFIIWMWRAAKNSEALGRMQPRFGPGWSIGGWFIPIANLVIPVLIMQDLWRASDLSVPRGDMRWKIGPRSALVGWWWAVWVGGLAVRVAAGGGNSKDRSVTLSDIRRSNTTALVGMAISMCACVLAILVVRRITERQEECLRAQQAAWTADQGTQAPPAVR